MIKTYTFEFHSNVCYALLPPFYTILPRFYTLSIHEKLYNEEFPFELQQISCLENCLKKSLENMILSKEICFHIVLYFCDNFYTMSLKTKVASRGFHIYKNTTWENVNIGQEISVQLETNEDSKNIDPYCCAIKTMVSEKLEAVGHISREVSSHTYFYIKEERGRIDGSVLSTRYRPSPIPSGGLEILLTMTFRSPRYITHQKMRDFVTKLYCYDHKPVM